MNPTSYAAKKGHLYICLYTNSNREHLRTLWKIFRWDLVFCLELCEYCCSLVKIPTIFFQASVKVLQHCYSFELKDYKS